MHARNSDTAPKGLREWWASPPRTGMRRLIAPWEYRHLQAWASARIAGAAVLVVLGALTLAFGGSDGKAYGWAAFWLVFAALQFAGGCWELTVVRSDRRRT